MNDHCPADSGSQITAITEAAAKYHGQVLEKLLRDVSDGDSNFEPEHLARKAFKLLSARHGIEVDERVMHETVQIHLRRHGGDLDPHISKSLSAAIDLFTLTFDPETADGCVTRLKENCSNLTVLERFVAEGYGRVYASSYQFWRQYAAEQKSRSNSN